MESQGFAQVQEKRKRTGIRQFLKDVRQELRKVDWPNRRELVSYTVVVLATIVVMTAFVASARLRLPEGRRQAVRLTGGLPICASAGSDDSMTIEYQSHPERFRRTGTVFIAWHEDDLCYSGYWDSFPDGDEPLEEAPRSTSLDEAVSWVANERLVCSILARERSG